MKNIKAMMYFLALMLVAISCSPDPFDTYRCGDKYLHVYYGGGVGGYKIVVLNHQKSMSFKGAEWYDEYKEDNTSKVIFDNDNPVAVSCGQEVKFTADSSPAVNTMDSGVNTKIVEPRQLIDIDTTKYDYVIR